ncbi:hypothetical protein HPY08_08425 [Vibrio cholerae]|uniref:restriction endonuclease subunit S n=1 Tax=Vibrio cholerae TaxID=666 RepID=UPI0015816788|nr:restriction endonuclease subunit S [Vibrio cholerae]QKU78948.1 hypothetical protein HPY08_08425 [Vibrio cholerae]
MSWSNVALSTLVDIKGGGTPSKANPEYWNGSIPWASVKDFKSSDLNGASDYITQEGIDNSATSLIPRGNLIVPTRMALGKIAINSVDIAINQDLKALIIKDESVVDTEYLFRCIQSKSEEIVRQGKGATVKGITVDVLKNLQIPLPPLETQKQIAAVLEKADQLRKDCKLLEQELNSLAQSVFIDMFGDPVTNPKGWDLKFLSSLGEVKGGLQVTSKRSVNPISVPYLRVANVYRDHLELEEVKEIQVTDKELKSVLLEKGDVLFVEGHGNANEVGRAAVWNNEIPQCVHQNHLIRFRPGPAIRPEFLSAFVNSASGRRQLLQMSKTTSGLNTLSTSNIKSIQVLVPPLQKQDEYLAFLASSKAQQWVNGQLSIELDENFNALMQKAFKGDLTL